MINSFTHVYKFTDWRPPRTKTTQPTLATYDTGSAVNNGWQ